MNDIEMSRFISLILRHKPDVIGITIDNKGYANVIDLINGINSKGNSLTLAKLEEIVRTDSKQRYSFNSDHTKIRANQGHSIKVDVDLKKLLPPPVLYHGTGEKYIDSIRQQGLIPKSRLYVHLSSDADTAFNVGKRHGVPLVLTIDAAQMSRDGFEFFLSENNVWLVKNVPARYIINIIS